jgi:hypothetical protein
MANFEYTYASWDKIRPRLLPKTGLGQALKKYESEKESLAKSNEVIAAYLDARKALETVETIRKKASSACSKNPLFKSAKTALDAARDDHEIEALTAKVGERIEGLLETFPDRFARFKERLEKEYELLHAALTLYEQKKEVPDNLAKFAKQQTGNLFLGQPHFAGGEVLRDFLSRKAAFKSALPDLVRQCERMRDLVEELPALKQKIQHVVAALKPYVPQD